MNSNTILIVDAPNYIKGFRYQMYCAARELKLRMCTVCSPTFSGNGSFPPCIFQVFVVATAELCREWNNARGADVGYASETYVPHRTAQKFNHSSFLQSRLDDLIMRYEEPSSMVRWDSPLFTVPWTEENIPAEQIWDAVTNGIVKPPNTGTQAVRFSPSSRSSFLFNSRSSYRSPRLLQTHYMH